MKNIIFMSYRKFEEKYLLEVYNVP